MEPHTYLGRIKARKVHAPLIAKHGVVEENALSHELEGLGLRDKTNVRVAESISTTAAESKNSGARASNGGAMRVSVVRPTTAPAIVRSVIWSQVYITAPLCTCPNLKNSSYIIILRGARDPNSAQTLCLETLCRV